HHGYRNRRHHAPAGRATVRFTGDCARSAVLRSAGHQLAGLIPGAADRVARTVPAQPGLVAMVVLPALLQFGFHFLVGAGVLTHAGLVTGVVGRFEILEAVALVVVRLCGE